jgi:hypothetical protein
MGGSVPAAAAVRVVEPAAVVGWKISEEIVSGGEEAGERRAVAIAPAAAPIGNGVDAPLGKNGGGGGGGRKGLRSRLARWCHRFGPSSSSSAKR